MEHSFDVKHAKRFGILEAVIIRHFQFWILKNRSNQSNQFEGRTWTYNSIKAFSNYFDYVSEKQVRGALDHLIREKVIVKNSFNQKGYDRTNWYAFVNESTFLKGQIDSPSGANGVARRGEPIPDTKPYNKPDKGADAPVLPFKEPEFANAWNEWLQHKAEKRKKLTPLTIKKQFAFLKQFNVTSAIDIINTSITNNWTGLFPPDRGKRISRNDKEGLKNFKF